MSTDIVVEARASPGPQGPPRQATNASVVARTTNASGADKLTRVAVVALEAATGAVPIRAFIANAPSFATARPRGSARAYAIAVKSILSWKAITARGAGPVGVATANADADVADAVAGAAAGDVIKAGAEAAEVPVALGEVDQRHHQRAAQRW